MTIGNALNFIERGLTDRALREHLNSASDMAQCENLLAGENLSFTAHDFDEAFHHRLTQCREEEEADQIREFRLWWDLLNQILRDDKCGPSCSQCGR